jgi:hypothetical protein
MKNFVAGLFFGLFLLGMLFWYQKAHSSNIGDAVVESGSLLNTAAYVLQQVQPLSEGTWWKHAALFMTPCLVASLPRYCVTNSAFWIGYVPTPPGDKVHMTMHHRPASDFPCVDSDIEPANRII